jgi:hypothetical protein
VRVTEGSTYTSFGRKLAIENGFFTFNGPVSNPGVNILAMRRNQEVEAGVQVTGTIQSLTVKLVSEPNVTDNEKLSWLLFGHGTDQGNNVGQQGTMTAALALLGSVTGAVAQTFGLDEFSIGRSDVGLTDPQVIQVSKAINERFVLGFEQGLQSASNAFKATINLTLLVGVRVRHVPGRRSELHAALRPLVQPALTEHARTARGATMKKAPHVIVRGFLCCSAAGRLLHACRASRRCAARGCRGPARPSRRRPTRRAPSFGQPNFILRGARLATITVSLPTSCSG